MGSLKPSRLNFTKRLPSLIALIILFVEFPAFATTPDIPQTITLDGRLYNGTSTTDGLSDPSVDVVVQILSADKTCILYEEEQVIDTRTSDGLFTIQIGSVVSATKRSVNDSNNPMALVFQNLSTIPAKGAGCVNPYTPSGNKERYVRLTVTPTGGAPDVLSPDMLIDAVPNALVAETLQGKDATGFLQLGNESLTQANAENIFTNANYGVLTSLLAGSSPNYVQIGASGANMPGFSSNPGAPAAGSVWYDTSTNVLKFYDGSQVQTVSENGHNAVQSVTTGTGLSGGTITASGTISLANTAVTAGSFGSATQVGSFAVNAQGQLTAAANVAIAGLDASVLTTGILPIARGGTGSSNGSIAGSGPLTFAAGGSNQNVSLSPSGSGYTLLGGNVGIGTATPGAQLDIEGSAPNAFTWINLQNNDTTGQSTSRLLVGNGSGGGAVIAVGPNFTGGGSLYGAAANSLWLESYSAGGIALHAHSGPVRFAAGGDSENMRVDSTGNVGIGTTAPSAKLQVSGDLVAGDGTSTGAGQITSRRWSLPGAYSAGTKVEVFQGAGSWYVTFDCDTSGTGGSNGTYIVTSRSWYTTLYAAKLTHFKEASEGDAVFTATGGNPVPVVSISFPDNYDDCTFSLLRM